MLVETRELTSTRRELLQENAIVEKCVDAHLFYFWFCTQRFQYLAFISSSIIFI